MTQPIDPASPQGRLHHAIRRCFTSAIAAYYKAHPEWFDDERARKGISALFALMHDVLNTVNDYEIRDHGERRNKNGK